MPRARQRVDDRDSEERSGKARGGDGGKSQAAERPVEGDREHRAERRARRHAEREGCRQRVSQQALEHHAGRGERCADERPGERARQAGNEEDLRVDVVGEGHRRVEGAAQVM